MYRSLVKTSQNNFTDDKFYGVFDGLSKMLLHFLTDTNEADEGQKRRVTAGCGKSFIASALGHHACTQGCTVAYFNTQKLLMKTKKSWAEGFIFMLFENLEKKLLIPDDFGLTHLEYQQQIELMEIIEGRHAISSIIITSQLPVANWFDVIGEETIADAILDRLVNTSHRIELKGGSQRKKL